MSGVNSIEFLPIRNEYSQLSEISSPKSEGLGKEKFGEWFANEMQALNDQILTSETNLEKLATGEMNNLHEVMMSLEKAKLSFQLTLQVRNKLLEGYQEIMRMQI